MTGTEVSAGSGATSTQFRGVVALDGPSGTGKSTVSRLLARRLQGRYLDTGAMYRAATVAVLRAGVALDDAEAIAATVRAARIEIGTDPASATVRLDGVDVSREIRSAEVTGAVSAVSAVPRVREQLVSAQRRLIGPGGIVVEGRDIASTVWPSSKPAVYLTASAQVRARRRAGELGDPANVDAVAADIERRDRLDSSRASSPLRRADGAVELDTTHLSIAEVVDHLVAMTVGSVDSAKP